MVVGWLQDQSELIGGAELTADQIRASCPDGVKVLDFTPPWDGNGYVGEIHPQPDVWVVHNCIQLPSGAVEWLASAPVVKYWHDVGPHVNPALREWLLTSARNVFCSPAQRDHMHRAYGGDGGTVLPPAMDLQPFFDAARPVDECDGVVWVGNMTNHGKGIRQAVEWADREQRTIRFYGDGPLRPSGQYVADWGPLPHHEVPAVLGKAHTLLFLPTALEPFGRVVAEAWAAGCKVITNELCGAAWWLEHQPDAIETAAQDFWHLVAETAA